METLHFNQTAILCEGWNGQNLMQVNRSSQQ